uniref:Uncharacterized protein n=1 Tax=Anguilla anguilla TaxID=7936 RepID=A0A0E9TRR2_ANGAN
MFQYCISLIFVTSILFQWSCSLPSLDLFFSTFIVNVLIITYIFL